MYLALYRKYRPLTFADVISQAHITTTLQNQIKNKQTAHAYLFTGSRGTGKTTCAKVLAKAVNCLSPEDGNPCLICDACLAVDNGATDVLEIDAASNNSVDDIRQLRDELGYLPVSLKYRVFIIDEVHMLSGSAFNALLKTIEEPPSHVVFILATTESHKVPATILSRCQRFEFHRIDIAESAARLRQIAAKEGFSLDENAAVLISRLSEGGMRDALSLLDTCISLSPEVTIDTVYESAGIAGKDHLFAISDAANSGSVGTAIKVIDTLHRQSKDLARLIDELIYHYRNLMLIKTVPEAHSLLSCLPIEVNEYRKAADKMSLHDIMRGLNILESCFERIGRSKNARITAETAIVELCTPALSTDVGELAKRVTLLEQGQVKATVVQPVAKQEKEPVQAKQEPVQVKQEPVQPKQEPVQAKQEPVQAKQEFVQQKPVPVQSEPIFDDVPAPWEDVPPPDSPSTTGVPPVEDIPPAGDFPPPWDEPVTEPVIAEKPTAKPTSEWAQILDSLPVFLSGMLDNCAADISGDTLILQVDEMSHSILENPNNHLQVKQAAEHVLGRAITLKTKLIKPEQKETVTKADIFINLARKKGVEVTIK